MKSLDIELKHCHGIRQLDVNFRFKNGNAVAVYAPNGTMKTSFARTFAEHARGFETQDRMFPDRETVRRITGHGGTELDGSDVVVVLSYDEELGPTEATSTLLVNPELRKEYEAIQRDLTGARDELVMALKKASGTSGDVVSAVSRAFTKQEKGFYTALVRLSYEIEKQDDAPLADVPYDLFFNSKVAPILRMPAIQSTLAEYVTRLNELLDASSFFSRDSFSFYEVSTDMRCSP